MKKRILAFALTLAMVVTSLSMLSFVSFADDVAQSESTAKDFYAYRGTLNVDSRLGVDDLWVAVNKEIAPSVVIGMSWDYDNVYLALYQEPATNGVSGTRADYLENAVINIGGVEVAVDWAAKTFTLPEGSDAKVALGGNYDVEISVPLSEITLDAAALAAGKLVVPTELDINQVYADESIVNTTEELNVILSGRSLAYQTDRINPSGAHANGTSMFGSGHVYDRLTAVYVSGTDDFKATSTFSGGQGTAHDPLTVVDKMLADGKIEFVRNSVNLHELLGVANGGQSYTEYQFTINNLPVNGEMTAVDNVVSYTNKPSYIVINSVGIGASSMGTLVNIYNAGGEAGLSVYYPTAIGNKSVSLGVAEGETFWLGFNEVSTDKIEIYVNDVCIASDMIASNSAASSDRGYVWVASHRGNSGAGTNGYSLDLNQDGVVDDEECISFVMADTAFASVAPVDVEKVASLTKGGTTYEDVLFAHKSASPRVDVNVGSLAIAYAGYDYANKTLNLVVSAVNLDSVKVNVGGFEATATIGIADAEARPDTMGATLDAESAAVAGVSYYADGMRVMFTIPMNKIVMSKDAIGNPVADLQIYVEKSDKATDKEGRLNCVTDGTFDGTLVFVPIAETLADATAPGLGANAAVGIVAGGSGTFTYESNGTVVAGATNMGQHLATTDRNREIAFDFTAIKMPAYESKDIPAINIGATAGDYAMNRAHFYFLDNKTTTCKGQIMFAIYNTSDKGLVLAYFNATKNAGSVIPLGVEVGETVSLVMRYNADNSGFISANGIKIVEEADIRSQKNGNSITGGAQAGLCAYIIQGDATTNFSLEVTNASFNRYNIPVTADQILAASANSNAVVSDGAIKLSYVQETTPTAFATFTGNALTGGTAAGNGGVLSNGNATMTVNNTASRAYSQGRLKTLANYGDRTIEFTLNVQNLNAYDFSNGGALEGNAKYTENINATHGIDIGIGAGDLTVHAFDKLLIGATASVDVDGITFANMAMYVVKDTTDGLVLVHTSKDGVETVIVVGDKMATDIAVTLVWNKDNAGAIVVDGNRTALADCRTVQTPFPKKDADTAPQCYFGGWGTAVEGYFGLNSVWSTENGTEGYVVPNASVTLGNVTVTTGDPLNVRFVATINTLDAKVAGFDINLKGSEKVVTKTTDTAYNAISTNGDLDKIYAPDGSYFIAVTINDVPATGTVTFVVRPFYTFAGETIYGTAYAVTYTDGVYMGAAVAE